MKRLSTGVALLYLFFATTANARVGERPFEASGTAIYVGSEQGYAVHDVIGTATQLGPWSGIGLVKGGAGHSEVFIALHSANGDSLDIQVLQRLNHETGVFEGFFAIVGGTGRFAAATGAGAFSAVSIAGGANIDFEGVIDF